MYTRAAGATSTAVVTAVAVLKMNGCGEGGGCDAVMSDGAVLRIMGAPAVRNCTIALSAQSCSINCKLAATCDLKQSTRLLAPCIMPYLARVLLVQPLPGIRPGVQQYVEHQYSHQNSSSKY